MKVLIVVALVAILGALGSAGFFMLRRKPDDGAGPAERDKRMARALALRVGISVLLFLLILLGWWAGWITPSGALGGGR